MLRNITYARNMDYYEIFLHNFEIFSSRVAFGFIPITNNLKVRAKVQSKVKTKKIDGKNRLFLLLRLVHVF